MGGAGDRKTERWRGRDGEKVIAQETKGTDHINKDLFIPMLQSISKVRSNLVIEYLSIV